MDNSNSKYDEGNRIHSVIVFLCTPRCGTQWFGKNLSELYSDSAIVLHEPLGNHYDLKNNLGRFNGSPGKTVNQIDNPAISKHFDFIEEVTQQMNYIEIGWPGIAGVSAFHRRFGDRLKLVHLYRNPVYVAASLVTHNWYTGRLQERFEKAELNPFDDAAFLKEYKNRREDLNVFEKSLYYWTEINLRALEIKYRYPGTPFYGLRFGDLFDQEKEKSRITLMEFLSFMGLPFEDKMMEALDVRYDNYQSRSVYTIDWKDIFGHPQTVALANRLGYRFDKEIDLSRYKKRRPFKRFYLKMRTLLNGSVGGM